LFEGLESVRIVGACPERVRIEAEGLGVRGATSLGALTFWDVPEVHVSGVTIRSDRRGVLVVHDASGRAVTVTDVVVERSDWHGISVYGAYPEVEVARCRTLGAVNAGVLVNVCPADYATVTADVRVDAVEVGGIRRCERFETCADFAFAIGIGVFCASDASVADSLVHDFDQAAGGVWLTLGDNATVTGSVVYGLAGMALLSLDGDAVTVRDNRLADCTPGEVDGTAHESCLGLFLDGDGKTGMVADVVGNFIADARPTGIEAGSAGFADAMDLTLERNELRDLDLAILHSIGGNLTLTDNRFRAVRVALSSTGGDGFAGTGNELRDGLAQNRLPAGSTRDFLDSLCCQLSVGPFGSDEVAELRGNHFSGLPVLDAADVQGGAACFVGVPGVQVDGNVFEGNLSEAGVLVAGFSTVDLRANLFLGVDDGVADPPGGRSFAIVGSEAEGGPARVSIEGNDVRDFMGGSGTWAGAFLFQREAVEFELFDNRLWRVGTLTVGSPSAAAFDRVALAGNDMTGPVVLLHPARQLTIEGNRFRGAYLALLGFPAAGTASLTGNWFEGSIIDARRPAGTFTVQGNEFRASTAMGLLLRSPAGDTVVDHNIFDGVTAMPWTEGAVGTVGDGLAVTGTPNEPGSGVRVTRNRFHDAGRWGLIVSGAAAFVEGNRFDGGAAEGCAFAIQNEPQAGAVSGGDVPHAARPQPPVGVVTVDELTAE